MCDIIYFGITHISKSGFLRLVISDARIGLDSDDNDDDLGINIEVNRNSNLRIIVKYGIKLILVEIIQLIDLHK